MKKCLKYIILILLIFPIIINAADYSEMINSYMEKSAFSNKDAYLVLPYPNSGNYGGFLSKEEFDLTYNYESRNFNFA